MNRATVPAVTDRDAPAPVKPHKMAMAMATETLMDIVGSARALEAAIIDDHGVAAQEKIRETARAQFEAYLDLTAQAATHVRALKP